MTTKTHPALDALREIAAGNSDAPGVRSRRAIRRLAGEAIPQLEALLTERDDLLAALKDLVDDGTVTDSGCDSCEKHAPKNDDGIITGPLKHADLCFYGRAFKVIAKAEEDS